MYTHVIFIYNNAVLSTTLTIIHKLRCDNTTTAISNVNKLGLAKYTASLEVNISQNCVQYKTMKCAKLQCVLWIVITVALHVHFMCPQYPDTWDQPRNARWSLCTQTETEPNGLHHKYAIEYSRRTQFPKGWQQDKVSHKAGLLLWDFTQQQKQACFAA